MRDLHKHFVPLYATRWKDIGVYLGIELVHLDTIRANHPHDVENCFSELLEKWLMWDTDATWDKLFTAIDDSDPVPISTSASNSTGTAYLTCYYIATWDKIE